MGALRTLTVLLVAATAAGCSWFGDPENEELRRQYQARTEGSSHAAFYGGLSTIAVATGAAAAAVPIFGPAVHQEVLAYTAIAVDTAVMYWLVERLIFGNGSLIAREKSCPLLIEREDLWNVFIAVVEDVRTSEQFQALSRQVATHSDKVVAGGGIGSVALTFRQAIRKTATPLVGARVAGALTSAAMVKRFSRTVSYAGPIAAGSINAAIMYLFDKTSVSYYEAKVTRVCGRK